MKFLESFNLVNWIKANPVLFGVIAGLVVLFLITIIGFVSLKTKRSNRK